MTRLTQCGCTKGRGSSVVGLSEINFRSSAYRSNFTGYCQFFLTCIKTLVINMCARDRRFGCCRRARGSGCWRGSRQQEAAAARSRVTFSGGTAAQGARHSAKQAAGAWKEISLSSVSGVSWGQLDLCVAQGGRHSAEQAAGARPVWGGGHSSWLPACALWL
jgi:hypothetical protein